MLVGSESFGIISEAGLPFQPLDCGIGIPFCPIDPDPSRAARLWTRRDPAFGLAIAKLIGDDNAITGCCRAWIRPER